MTFDGDMCCADFVYSNNAIAEIDRLLDSPSFYLGAGGGFKNSVSTDTIDLVLYNLTGDPVQ